MSGRIWRLLRDPLPRTLALLLALVFGMDHLRGLFAARFPDLSGPFISRTALSRWWGRICRWWQSPA